MYCIAINMDNRLLETKQKLVGLLISLIIIISAIYFNLKYIEETHGTSKCVDKLNSVKHQLNEIIEYNKVKDIQLTETKKKNNRDKARFDQWVESCYETKDEIYYCQVLTKVLEKECNNTKEQYYKLKEETEKKKQNH